MEATFFNHEFYHTEEFSKAYNLDNYEIIETPDFPISEDDNPQKLPTCVVYFSSAGLYKRENCDNFREMIFEKNRYEWKKNLIKTAQKHIFLRDVYITWYVKGINSKINSHEKIIEFLKEQTKGHRVILIGASAGGYMATYAGIKLNAYKVYTFCGQFGLRYDKVNFESIEGDLETLVRENQMKNIYYFSARDFINDVIEYKFTLTCPKVRTFLFKTDTHGVPFPISALTDILNMPKSKLEKLYAHYEGKEINILDFGYKVTGLKFIFPILNDSVRHFRKFAKNAFK